MGTSICITHGLVAGLPLLLLLLLCVSLIVTCADLFSVPTSPAISRHIHARICCCSWGGFTTRTSYSCTKPRTGQHR
jgi:hypothetical protein